MLNRIILIAVFIGLSASLSYGQSEDGQVKSGSAYSKLGIGYPVEMGNTASQSMGLLGVSFNDTFVGNLANPALWGSTVYGLGVGGIGVQSYNASNTNTSATNSNLTINHFQLQLPIARGKFGISGSFSPLTEASFRTYEETQRITYGTLQDTLNFGVENRGGGGVNRAELGFGWKISSNIFIGYAPSVVFLSQDDAFTATFPQQPYRDVNFKVETNGVGFGNRVGTFIQLPNLFRENDQLGIGATVSLPVTLDSERKQTGVIAEGGINTTTELENGKGTIKLPMKISGGISYSPNNLLMVGAEGFYEGWSDYQNDFKTDEEQLFVNRYKMGLGLQYFPYVTGSNKFLSKFKYRAGASYDTGHLRIEGQRINTLKFSLGLGIRSPRSSSSIDLSFEYGIRGTKSLNLVQEHIWGVNLSLNLAELMFFRPKLQ